MQSESNQEFRLVRGFKLHSGEGAISDCFSGPGGAEFHRMNLAVSSVASASLILCIQALLNVECKMSEG